MGIISFLSYFWQCRNRISGKPSIEFVVGRDLIVETSEFVFSSSSSSSGSSRFISRATPLRAYTVLSMGGTPPPMTKPIFLSINWLHSLELHVIRFFHCMEKSLNALSLRRIDIASVFSALYCQHLVCVC